MKKQKSDSKIEITTTSLRELTGSAHVNAPDLVSVLKKFTDVVPEFSYERVLDDELPDASAMADCKTKTIYFRESLFQKLLDGDTRARWTVAHEIGHIILGHQGNRFRKDQIGKLYGWTRIEEREADVFASRFLVPTVMATACKDAFEIAQKFQISLPAAEIRLKELSAMRGRKLPREITEIITDMKKQWKR